MSDDPRRLAPATRRNRDPILAVLRAHLPSSGLVVEIASGTGEHAAHFAAALPGLDWQPTEPTPEGRASIDAWGAGLPNLRPALALDAAADDWPLDHAEAVFCANMIHIAPWSAAEGLFRGAARLLPAGAPLILYGPYRREGQALEPSNADFDADLRRRNPEWGLRELGAVAALAASHGFSAPDIVPMPANNLMLIFYQAG